MWGIFFFLAKAKTHASEIFYPWDPLALKASACFPDPANSPLSLNQPLFLNAPSHSLNPKPQIPNSTFHFHFPFFFSLFTICPNFIAIFPSEPAGFFDLLCIYLNPMLFCLIVVFFCGEHKEHVFVSHNHVLFRAHKG